MAQVDLARLQFGATSIYHYLFVPLTLGLVLLVAIMETRYVTTGNETYKKMTKFWGHLYVINYAVGIVSGIIQEFQFGLNWSNYSRFVGDVFGVPLAIETLLAFFLESTFLGIWLFGWDQLSKRAHLVTIWLVTIGAYFSAVWIMLANSWMQNPIGYTIQDGQAVLTDFWVQFSNSSFLTALPHVIAGSFVTGAFFVLAVSAYHFLRLTPDQDFFLRSVRPAMQMAFIGSLLAIVSGGLQFASIVRIQPDKFQVLRGESLVATSLEIMLWSGIIMFFASIIGLFMLRKNRISRARWFLWLLLPVLVLPYLANIGGWLFREIGRQPWIVQGLLKTEDAISPNLTGETILFWLVAILAVYTVIAMLNVYLISSHAKKGYVEPEQTGQPPKKAQLVSTY
jgi:cytochrome bd ubiquinol oxidase subunit I